MNKLKESKVLYIALSILIASVLWLYVVSEVNPDASAQIRDIPIIVTGQDVMDSRGLMITAQSVERLTVHFTGKRNSLVKLTPENVTITVDVSAIASEGEYDLRCNVVPPNTATTGTISVEDRESYRIQMTVEKKTSKTVEVKGEFTGSVAEGYQAETFILSPSNMVISGAASVIENIDYAVVTLSVGDLNTTYSGILPFEFVTFDGTRIPATGIECAASTIYVVYPVVMVREVALAVDFTAGGGATMDHVSYEIEPATIQISGKETDVAGVKEITLGNIDLSKVGGSTSFTFPIALSGELTNESGVSEATVTVKVTGLTSKILETDNIEIINQPQGYTAEAVTQSIQVVVRGEQEAVNNVLSHQLRVVADLSELSASAGQFRVPVKIYLDGAGDVGVVGGDYTISVTLSR